MLRKRGALIFPLSNQMSDSLSLALAIAIVLFVGFLLLRAYYPSLFTFGSSKPEPFVTSPPTPPQAPKPIEQPAPAPKVLVTEVEEGPRTVSPGGPNPPAARAPEMAPAISPEPRPVDPYDDHNMEAPISDTLRYPELSFGPGIDNTGTKLTPASGVGSAASLVAQSPFSPEFAQNGGLFMEGISANDLTQGGEFASA
jgi:hypothetical protein